MTAGAEVYKVTLQGADGQQQTIQMREREYFLDAAERQGIELPFDCRVGSCVACVGRVVKGSADKDVTILKPNEIEAGFVLTCRAFPTENCTVLTHQEDALFEL